jgi:hypothetical protein
VGADDMMLGHVREFAVGDSVSLRGCRTGQPGRVLRVERGKLQMQ